MEDRDYFTEKNVFWVPTLARWDYSAPPESNANYAESTELETQIKTNLEGLGL